MKPNWKVWQSAPTTPPPAQSSVCFQWDTRTCDCGFETLSCSYVIGYSRFREFFSVSQKANGVYLSVSVLGFAGANSHFRTLHSFLLHWGAYCLKIYYIWKPIYILNHYLCFEKCYILGVLYTWENTICQLDLLATKHERMSYTETIKYGKTNQILGKLTKSLWPN